MEKYYKYVLLAFITLSVMGCSLIDSDTNEEPEELILGNWYQTGYSIDGQYSDWPDDDLRMYDYQPNGEISVFKFVDEKLTYSHAITYILEDGSVEISGVNGKHLYTIVKLDELEYVFVREFDVYGDGNLSIVEYHHERRY